MTGRAPGPGPTSPPLGNDVVDLADPRCRGKGTDERFLARVLAGPEREAVGVAPDRDLALWRRWAAKEAAYKAATVALGVPPVFTHAAFVVEDTGADAGVVRWRELTLPFRVAGGRDEGGLHVVAWAGRRDAPVVAGGTAWADDDGTPLERLLERLSERECRAVHSRASARVRLHARSHLASLAGIVEERLEIVCEGGAAGRTPPRVLLDGEPSNWTVGLSHHRALLGWVLGRAPEEGEEGRPVVAPAVARRAEGPGSSA